MTSLIESFLMYTPWQVSDKANPGSLEMGDLQYRDTSTKLYLTHSVTLVFSLITPRSEGLCIRGSPHSFAQEAPG